MGRPTSLADLSPDAARQAGEQIRAQSARQKGEPKKRGNPEEILHRHVADYLRVALPPEVVFIHVPMGAKRSKAEAGKLKAMGARAGVPDICVMWRKEFEDHAYVPAVLWIEMKAPRGTLSSAQSLFMLDVMPLGHHTAVARSVEEVEQAILRAGVRGIVGGKG